ncbi:type II secretion system protein [Alteromonas sp. S015]|uniref:type II secretion system protein n=1 Tax=Alteromonas sp. S015 TaxID=3117401 RepID=UPI002FE0B69A
MEENFKAYTQHPLPKGVTLSEILIATAIAGILCVATMPAIITSKQLSHLNKVKAYLLSVQAIQSRSWLRTGKYLTHDALPPIEISSVSIAQTISSTGKYEIVATLATRALTDRCRIIKITEDTLTPTECW